MLPHEITRPAPICPGNMDGAFPLQEPDDLGHGIRGRNGEQEMHVILMQVTFLHSTLSLAGQGA